MDALELLKEFNNLGCKDEIKCGVAYRGYINLKEVCKLEDIERIYSIEKDVIYFRVKTDENPEIYFPVSSCEDIDFLDMEEMQQSLCSGENSGFSFIVSICDPNSTVLYYKLTNDWTERTDNANKVLDLDVS